MLFARGVTRTVISPRVGQRPGIGEVEVTSPVADEAGKTVELGTNPVDVFNAHQFEIPAGMDVAVTGGDGQWTVIPLELKCAVRIPDLAAVHFLTEPPTDPDGFEIELGAWVDIASNVHAWPPSVKAPEQVLCRSRENPKHYKLYKYRREIENSEDWEDTGLVFGGTFTAEGWDGFAKGMISLLAINALGDEEEA